MAPNLPNTWSARMRLPLLLFFFLCSSVKIYAQNISITSVVPNEGKAGDVITINGQNLGLNNVVFFGNKKASVITATNDFIMVKVPDGADYDYITVTNPSTGYMAQSSTRFVPLISPAKTTFGSRDFKLYDHLSDGLIDGAINDFVLLDVNRDGKPDLITANGTAYYPGITLRLNNSTSTNIAFQPFISTTDMTAYGNEIVLATGDINRDGYPDLVVGLRDSPQILVMYNNGDNLLRVNRTFNAGIPINNLVVTDINGDGLVDILVGSKGSGQITLLQNTSVGTDVTFSPLTLNINDQFRNLYVQDIDADGIPDIIGSLTGIPVFFVVKGTVDGVGKYAFGNYRKYSVAESPSDILFYDFNQDGKPELILAYGNMHSLGIMQPALDGNQELIFRELSPIKVSGAPIRMSMADMNGDKSPDILVSYSLQTGTGFNAGLLLNRSTGPLISFDSEQLFAAKDTPMKNIITDLNNDNKPDLIIGSSINHSISIYQNQISLQPVIKTISPTMGPAGSSMVITCDNANAVMAKNQVLIGGIPATVTGSTSTLVATIPAGTAIGPVTLTNLDNGLQASSGKYYNQIVTPNRNTLGQADLQHTPSTDLALNFKPYYLLSADFDNDGKPDLMAANFGFALNPLSFQFFTNSSSNKALSFTPTTTQPFTNSSYSATGQPAIADFDGDGKIDVVFPGYNNSAGDAIVYANTGTMSNWPVAGTFPVGIPSDFTDGVDIDGDGLADIFTASVSTGEIAILRNTSTAKGSFAFVKATLQNSRPVGFSQQFAKLVDIDGDNKPDIVSLDINRAYFYVWRNTSTPGNISFATPSQFGTIARPQNISIADVDGDGKQDVVIQYAANVFVYLNASFSGSPSFAPAISMPSANSSIVTVGDINGDGYPDLITGNTAAPFINAYANYGAPGPRGFNTAGITVNDAGDRPYSFVTGDFNRDGRTDVVAALANSSVLKTYLANIVTAPTSPANNIVLSNITDATATISWTNGNGEKRAVFVKAQATDNAAPANGIEYTANTIFKSGGQIGTSGWYCVYTGTGNTVNISGLTGGSSYTVMVAEYNTGGIAGNAFYQTATANDNPASFTTKVANLPCDVATSQTNGVSMDCSLCTVLNPTNGADKDSTTYSILMTLVGTSPGSIFQTLKFPEAGTSDDIIKLKLGILNTTISSGMLNNIKINTENGGVSNNDVVTLGSSSSALSVVVEGGLIYVKYKPGKNFDAITITTSGSNPSLNIYYATKLVASPVVTPDPAIICTGITTINLTATSLNATIDWYDLPSDGIKLGTSGSGLPFTTPTITATTTYYVQATRTSNGCVNTVRTPVTVTVGNKPVLTKQPADTAAIIGILASFSLEATAAGGIKGYQWQINTGTGFKSVTDAGAYSGTTTGTITIKSPTAGMSGYQFRPIVTGLCGSVYGNIATLTVGKGDQTISFNQFINGSTVNTTYGVATFSAAAKSTSNLSITYSSNNPDVATIDNNGNVTITGAGDVTIQASQAGNASYNEAVPATLNIHVVPASLTITAENTTKTYGSPEPEIQYTVAGLIGNDKMTGVPGRTPGENAGNYQMTLGTLYAGSNYYLVLSSGTYFTITPQDLIVTPDHQNKVYGTNDPVLTYTVTGLLGNDQLTGNLEREVGENIGTYYLKPGNLTAGANYVLDIAPQTLVITPAQLAVKAIATGKTYGEDDPELEYTVDGLVNNDRLSGTLSRTAGENAGAYPISQGTLTSSPNYSINFTGDNFTIAPATVTVTAAPATKIYGYSDPQFLFTATGLLNNDVVTGMPARITGENAGNYNITQGTLNGGINYTINFIGNTLEIIPAGVTVTATLQSKVYGESDPAFSYTSTGLLGNDQFTGALSRTSGENAGSYDITAGTLSAGNNYTITFNSNKLNITPAALTITADPKTKVYGTTDPALTYTTSGLLNSDPLSGTLGRNAGEQVGDYAITQGSVSAGNNYIITFYTRNLSITPAALSINADAKSKTYGTSDPALTYTITGITNGDQLSGKLSRDPGENAGSYSITQGSLSAGNNYTITFNNGKFDITPAALTVTATTKTKVYGTNDPALTYTSTGLINNDLISGILNRDAGENVGQYNITQGSLSAGNNYNISFNSSKLDITPAALSITADAKSKVYGTSDPALTYATIGLVAGDQFTGALTREAGENTGLYNITQGSLSAGNNYNITFNSNKLNITPAALSISADAKSKVYGTSDPALTYATTGLVPGDQLTGALTRDGGENTGQYSITHGSLSAGNNYTISFTGNKLTINTAALTVTADVKTKVYGTGDPALTYTASGLLNSDKLSGALSRNTGENVGDYAITQGSLSAGNNYTITFNTRNLSITPAALSINADAKSKTFGTSDPALTYTTTGLITGDQLSGKLSRDAGENAGSYAITKGTLSAGNNYTATFTGNTFTINKATQTITWSQTLSLGCDGNTSIQLNAAASSGFPVSYQINNTTLATINGSTLTATGSGAGVISASQAGDNNYEAAVTVTNNVNILLPSMVRQHWNDVLMFDNTNNNYLTWQWYKNNTAVTGATSQYFNENGALNGIYYVMATDKNGNQVQSCPINVSASGSVSGGISVAPNPVAKGATATVTSRYTEVQLNGAMLLITDITGKTIAQYKTVLPVMQVKMPMDGGFYIVTLLFTNGQKATTNVIVN
ncbi:MBG domain-containing protein [Chitinophaga sp. Cy-1792]|uniref:MBG domain-containing protein n=1 Tax=Chitinophaga sp. Cy-1792 TaxID=2608339 RepID=UPI00142254DC|nr:MBG domain-containing protein [Chitinophaga sp. Cy-1792]NIG53603.1 hypothetical protein [Chitinophaga sp. Cy-1792]